jgi:hypothetical protein
MGSCNPPLAVFSNLDANYHERYGRCYRYDEDRCATHDSVLGGLGAIAYYGNYHKANVVVRDIELLPNIHFDNIGTSRVYRRDWRTVIFSNILELKIMN